MIESEFKQKNDAFKFLTLFLNSILNSVGLPGGKNKTE